MGIDKEHYLHNDVLEVLQRNPKGLTCIQIETELADIRADNAVQDALNLLLKRHQVEYLKGEWVWKATK